MSPKNDSIAIVGCGLIGESWAALFLAHGYNVRAFDPNQETAEGFGARVNRPLAQLRELGATGAGCLTVTETLAEAVAGVVLIQENAPENIPLKRALLREIEENAPQSAIIASSTSALTWSDISPDLQWPHRLVTAHPFNPPHLVPLVELYGIDDAIVVQAEAIYRNLGRHPVRLKKDAVGHIANRLASALWREAVHIVAEGIADVEAVDAALVHGPGLRWSVVGAHMVYHLGGGTGGISHYLQHLGPSQVRRWQSLGSPDLTPEVCAALIEGIAREAAGRSIEELEADRDFKLINALKAREIARG